MLAATAPREEALALDGKTLRGSQKQGAPAPHLLSVVSHRLGLTVGQAEVDAKTNEIPVAREVLAGLVLQGRVVTMDALLTQRALADQIVAGGWGLRDAGQGQSAHLGSGYRHGVCFPPAPGEQRQAVVTQDQGHGRREWRRLTCSDVLADYLDWPGQ